MLTEDETDYMAIIQNGRKCSIEDLIHGITGEGSILRGTECVAVTHAIFRQLGKKLREGQSFSSEYLTTVARQRLSVRPSTLDEILVKERDQ